MTHSTSPAPPRAERKPLSATWHGETLSDDYAWLRDPAYPQVSEAAILAHLEAENAWFEHRMAGQADLVETLYREMRGRIKEADSSVPQKDGDWLYWVEYAEGGQYKTWWRRPTGAPGDGSANQLILDEPTLAEGKDYFSLGCVSVSSSGRVMAYSVDETGGERYTIRFKRLDDGTELADSVENAAGKWGEDEVEGTIGNIVWNADETAVLYTESDANWRQRTIKLHRIGTAASEDVTIYHEPDEGFSCGVALGAQEQWIIIQTGDHETSEVRLIPAADPLVEPILVREREPGVEYSLDLRDGTLFIVTNDEHENFRLATAPLASPGQWATLIAGSDEF